MNLLKISGLVIGTGSVVGGTGAGIYYGVIKNSETENTENNEIENNNVNAQRNQKSEFTGKLVFSKKADSSNTLYIAKLLTTEQYDSEVSTFNTGINDDNNKYTAVNKILDISHSLNITEVTNELNTIFGTQTTFQEVKTTILSNEAKLKELFGDTIYENLKILIT